MLAREGVRGREGRSGRHSLHFIRSAGTAYGQLGKVGTKKSYISRLENGKCDIQLSTLYRIFEFGLGKRVNLTIG
jgi:transcriptional regulator with XRE-family HTH domain